MLKFSRHATLLLVCAAPFVLASCAHGGTKADTAYVARDVSSLYTAAQRTMNNGDYEAAAKLFDEVERQHPYSVWARHAQVMSAFNYYLAQKYTQAISSAQRFLTIHPGSDEAAYAQYIVAMSYYQQIPDVTQDQSATQSASSAFNELIRQGTKEGDIRVETPLIGLKKREIVRLGVELAAPFHVSWSCYSGEKEACGVCESCVLRLRAFREAGAVDPIPYAGTKSASNI